MDVTQGSGRIDVRLRTRPRSEIIAFGKLMAALSMMKARDVLIGFQVEVYEDATVDVPLPVLTKAVATLTRTPGAWRPDPGDLVGLCEQVRLELRGTLAFASCEACSADGWVEREINGVKRMTRCECWKAHQQRIAALGGTSEPLALPPARERASVGGDE